LVKYDHITVFLGTTLVPNACIWQAKLVQPCCSRRSCNNNKQNVTEDTRL